MRYLIPFLILLTSCTTTQQEIKAGTYISITRVYETQQEVEAVCGRGYDGCWKFRNGVNWIYSNKSRCTIDHEFEHMFFGLFHGNMKATCKVRAN